MAKEFVYKGRSAKSIQQRAQSSGDYDRWFDTKYPMFKPKEGRNKVRFLPPGWMYSDKLSAKWGDQWRIDVSLHRNIGPDNATYLCPAKMLGKDCSVCDVRGELAVEEDGNPKYSKKDENGKRVRRPSDDIKANGAALSLVIDRKNEEAGPQFWVVPKGVMNELNIRQKDEDTGAAILIDDPEEGFDVTFERTGTGITTKYGGVDVSRKPTPLSTSSKQQRRWLDYIKENLLFNSLIYHDSEYMEKVYMGKKVKNRDEDEMEDKDLENDEDEDNDDDDDDKPSKKKTKKDDVKSKKSKKKSKSDDDDDDEDEDKSDDDDDDDEDEKPSKKKKSKSKDDDDDEDEDEDDSDDDDDDEDEKPKKKAKKGDKSKKKSKSKDDDDDDDDKDEDDEDEEESDDDDDDDSDDEDEDDDEDEKPKKGSKSAKKSMKKLKKKR